MFHDKALHDSRFLSLAFDLNAHAVRLACLVEWYKARGERTLPVQYLKRIAFTRRQWELATKGSRKYSGHSLVDKAPAKDGCEAIGLISEYIDICPDTKKPRTYWVIGEIDADVIARIRREREEAAFDVIEDRAPNEPDEIERKETSAPSETRLSEEKAYEAGYADGERAGYDRRSREIEVTRCPESASIVTEYTDVRKRHPGETPCDALKRAISAEIYLEIELRRESEKNLGF